MIKKEYIPNILTILRILLIPVFIFYILSFDYVMALICFFIASITDWADGYFARKFDVVSNFGTFWDPLADKLLVLSVFYLFLQIDGLSETVYLWMVVIILFRDISITFLRIIFQSKNDFILVTTRIAKFKTLSQLVTINWILVSLALSDLSLSFESTLVTFKDFKLVDLGYPLMLITTSLTLYTGLHYYYNNGKKIIEALSNK